MSKKFLFVFCVLFFVFCLASSAHAVYTYKLMEKIPGFESVQGSDFVNYVLAIFKFAIWTVGIAALLMIIIGGFMYITSAGNTSRMDAAKRVIFDSFYGLIVALAAWLLLYVINPDLVKINLALKAVESPKPAAPSPGGPGGPTTWPPAGLTPKDTDLRNQLAANGISINKADCYHIGQTGCTSLDGLPQSTVDKLIAAKSQIGGFTVTGGTEYWRHSSHGPGKPIVDIWPTAPKSQWDGIVNTLATQYGATAFCDVRGGSVPCTDPEAHIHVRF